MENEEGRRIEIVDSRSRDKSGTGVCGMTLGANVLRAALTAGNAL